MTLKTLVATNNRSTVNRVKRAFNDVDCEIIPATTLSLAVYLARKNFPDVILSDYELTDGDGLQLLQEIRSEQELQAIPFALFNSNSKDEPALDETQAKALGISALIANDTQGRELYERIMKLVRAYLAVKERRAEETPE
ncbi:MAG TPA: response regulator [Oculatellaceae cyanobacterium]